MSLDASAPAKKRRKAGLPLEGAIFFLDVPEGRQAKITSQLKVVGASVVPHFDLSEITHLLSSKPKPSAVVSPKASSVSTKTSSAIPPVPSSPQLSLLAPQARPARSSSPSPASRSDSVLDIIQARPKSASPSLSIQGSRQMKLAAAIQSRTATPSTAMSAANARDLFTIAKQHGKVIYSMDSFLPWLERSVTKIRAASSKHVLNCPDIGTSGAIPNRATSPVPPPLLRVSGSAIPTVASPRGGTSASTSNHVATSPNLSRQLAKSASNTFNANKPLLRVLVEDMDHTHLPVCLEFKEGDHVPDLCYEYLEHELDPLEYLSHDHENIRMERYKRMCSELLSTQQRASQKKGFCDGCNISFDNYAEHVESKNHIKQAELKNATYYPEIDDLLSF